MSFNFAKLSVALFMASSVATVQAQPVPSLPKIKFVSYNVENMFDSAHDADATLPDGKEDWTFLPLNHPLKEKCLEMQQGFYRQQCEENNWTSQKATWKVKNAAKVLKLTSSPDIISLAEIENSNVVSALATELGYAGSYIVSNSPDHRGIDVAFIFNKKKLKKLSSAEIVLQGQGLVKATRNILRAEFGILNSVGVMIPNTRLFVYANHWPSQAAPAAARVVAAKALKADIELMRSSLTGTLYFAALGDFNTVPSDNPHPFSTVITDKQNWPGALVDSEEWARSKVPALSNTLLPGSYWFSKDNNWSKLDHIFVSQNLVDAQGTDFAPETFSILKNNSVMQTMVPPNGPFQGQNIFIPQRFNHMATSQATMGYSDHLPVSVDLVVR